MQAERDTMLDRNEAGYAEGADHEGLQDEEEFSRINKIEILTEHGIKKEDIEKLKQAGYCTVESVAFSPRRALLKIKGFSEAKVNSLMEAAKKSNCVHMGFVSALEIDEMQKNRVLLTTGSKELDKILHGGIETGAITEVFGEARAGKTQFCLTLAVTCQLGRELGGGVGRCLYIDTEDGFRTERIREIAQRFDLDEDAVLENISYIRAYNSDQQTQILVDAAILMSESPFSLLIVDSATANYRADYSGRGELAERQMHLSHFLGLLHRFAAEFGVAVLITNQMVANVDGAAAMFGGPDKKPIGGNIMAHSSTFRLSLRKAKGNKRICKIFDAPNLPEAEASFSISTGGIEDSTD